MIGDGTFLCSHLTVLPQTPVARADAQFSVAVLIRSSADCHSSHPCVDASGESGGPAGRVRFLCYQQSTTDLATRTNVT